MKKFCTVLGVFYLACNAWSCGTNETGRLPEKCTDMTAECLANRPAVQSDSYQIKILSLNPEPPERGENTWTFQVNDQATQEPLEGCSIELIPFMPEHGHGSPKSPELTDLGSGEYSFSGIVFTMPGLWSMEFLINCGDRDMEQLLIDFTL